MVEMRIDISELKSEGSDLIKELVELLEEKIKVEVETATDEIILKSEEEAISRRYLRVLLRKFLHRTELKDYFRVISGGENTWVVREKKIVEE